MPIQYDFDQFFEGAHDMMPRKTQHVARGKKLGLKSVDDVMDQTTDIDQTYEDTDPETFEMMSGKNKKQVEDHAGVHQYATREMMIQGGTMAFAMDGLGNLMQVVSDEAPEEEETSADAMIEWFDIANHEFLDRTGNGEKWQIVANELARRFAEFFDGAYDAFEFAADTYAHRAREWGLVQEQLMVESFDRTGSFIIPKQTPIYEMKYRGKKYAVDTSVTEGFTSYVPKRASMVTIKNRSRKK